MSNASKKKNRIQKEIDDLKAYLAKIDCKMCNYWGDRFLQLLEGIKKADIGNELDARNKAFSKHFRETDYSHLFNEYQMNTIWTALCGNFPAWKWIRDAHKEWFCVPFPWGLNGEREWSMRRLEREKTTTLIKIKGSVDSQFDAVAALKKMDELMPELPEMDVLDSAKITRAEAEKNTINLTNSLSSL